LVAPYRAPNTGRLADRGLPPSGAAPSAPRHYETAAGRRPVLEFLRALSDADKAEVLAAMQEVRREGLRAARHLRDDIYEVRADGERVIYRVLFATEGRQGRILLSLVAFNKKTQRTPPEQIRLAQRRPRDWRVRSRTAQRKPHNDPPRQ
jgi:phage-related protein